MNQENEYNKKFINNNNLFNIEESLEKEQIKKLYHMERLQSKLSLRKKKLNVKLLNKRKIFFKNDENKKIDLESNSITDLFLKIEKEYKNEDKLIAILTQIEYIVDPNLNSKNNILDEDELTNIGFLEKIYNIIIIYINSPNVIFYISKSLLSTCLLLKSDDSSDNSELLVDKKETLNKRGYFISSDKYITVYNIILEKYLKSSEKIAQYMILFIAKVAEEEKINQISLYLSQTLNYIIESIDINNSSDKLFGIKIMCLSKFENSLIYENNFELSLKIQKIYIDIFLNNNSFDLFKDLNKEYDDTDLLYNFLKIIENTSSEGKNKKLIENMIKSNILEFLIDNFINANPILIEIIINILIDITNSESEIGKRLINIGIIKYLVIIATDKTFPYELRQASLVPIYNLMDINLWQLVLFGQKVLKVYCSLLNEQDIQPGIFQEISYGLMQMIIFCKDEEECMNIIIEEYYIIQLLCKSIKQIIINFKYQNQYNCFESFCYIIFELLSRYDDLTEKIISIFLKSGGEEILDLISSSILNIDLEDDDSKEKNAIISIENYVAMIKEKIKDI